LVSGVHEITIVDTSTLRSRVLLDWTTGLLPVVFKNTSLQMVLCVLEGGAAHAPSSMVPLCLRDSADSRRKMEQAYLSPHQRRAREFAGQGTVCKLHHTEQAPSWASVLGTFPKKLNTHSLCPMEGADPEAEWD
jgi:hypothetical protein